MPSKIQLQPASQPVDTFVAPGVVGPQQTNYDFSQLRGLSQTLDAALTNDLERYKQLADRQATENEPRLVQLAKEQYRVLNSSDPLTADFLKQLKDQGFEGTDNPYVQELLRKSAAVYQVRKENYSGFLRDPAWFREATNTYLFSKEQGDKMLADRRQTFLERVGTLTSDAAKTAALAEIGMQELQFHDDVTRAKSQLADMHHAMAAANAIQPAIDSAILEYAGDPRPDLKQATQDGLKTLTDQMSVLLGPEKADAIIAQGIENSLLQAARTDGEAALHALDGLRDAVGNTGTMAPRFAQIESAVRSEIRSMKEHSSDQAPKARAALSYRIDRALASQGIKGSKEIQEWLYNGPGQQLVEDTAKEFGIQSDLMGDIQGEKLRFWTAVGADKSDEKLLTEIISQARKGDIDGAEARLAASDSTQITPSSRLQALSFFDSERKRGYNSPEAKTHREESWGLTLSYFGPLAQDGETGAYVDTLKHTFDASYNSWLEQHPNDSAGASKAGRQAASSAPEWAILDTLRRQDNFAYISQTPEYTATVVRRLERRQDAERVQRTKEDTTGTQFDDVAHEQRWLDITSQVEDLMKVEYQRLRQDPEITKLRTQQERNSAIMSGLRNYEVKAYNTAIGNNPLKVSPQILDISSKAQVERIKTAQAESVDPKSLVVPGRDPGVSDQFSLVMGYIYDAAAGARAGSLKEFNSLEVLGRSEFLVNLQMALSARLVDQFNPKTPDEAEAVYKGGDPRTWQLGQYATNLPAGEGARKAMRAVLMTRGMRPQDVIAGREQFGVPLQDVFGDNSNPWYTKFPVAQIALYASPNDVEAAVLDLKNNKENSTLYKLLETLRLDPNNSEAVDAFASSQIALANRRSGAKFGFELLNTSPATDRESVIRNLMDQRPPVHSADPAWLKRVKMRATEIENAK